MRNLLRFTLVLACLSGPSAGSRAAVLKGQAVTYADFSLVNYISCSISHVYFATTEGIIRYNKLENRWEQPLTGASGIDNRDVRRIWVDRFDQKLYAEGSAGLYEYDLLFDRWFPVSEIPSLDREYVHIRTPDIMYAPFRFNYSNEGYLIDPHGRTFYFNDILDDRSGTLWIGTWGYGIAVAGSSSGIIELLPYGLLQNWVNAIYNDDGVLWVSGAAYASIRTGISVFDPADNSFAYIESGLTSDFPAADINCIEGDDDLIYIGTSAGLLLLNRENNHIERTITARGGLADDNVSCLKVIGDSVFIGTSRGMCLITASSDSIKYVRPHQFLNTDIYGLETTDSALWIASGRGAFQLKLVSGKLQKFQDPHMIVFNRAYQIERHKNDLWFASDAGIVRLNLKSGETRPYPSVFRSSGGRALAVNDRIAAVATDRGMTVHFLDDEHPHEREFTTEDGLPSNRVLSLLMDGDFIWIGTDRGLTRFLWNNPDRID